MQVYREITPLKDADVFVLLDSVNKGFDYPIHNHPEFELNLVMGISGTRIVGDSTERYYEEDLVLLGPYLYHKWDADPEQLNSNVKYRVITIQFAPDLLDSKLLQKELFYHIRQLLQQSGRGIRVYGKTLQILKAKLIKMAETKGFNTVIEFLSILDIMSQSGEIEYLASTGFNPKEMKSESRRIQKTYQYILRKFHEQDLKLLDVANQVNMSESAFSHFFRKYTNKSFTQFLIDIRIGYACKLLLDTDDTVNKISYDCGFNNIANFNRLFKKYRSCTPGDYRQQYKEKIEFDWTHQVTPYQFVPQDSDVHIQLKPETYATNLVHS